MLLTLTNAGIHFPVGTPLPEDDVLWVVRAQRYSCAIDPETDHYGVTDPRPEAWFYLVERRTACGAWIRDHNGERRFVRLNTTGKRYAYNTISDALDGLIARRKRQLQILAGQTARAQEELELAECGRMRRAEFDALIKRAATDDPFAPLLRERSPFLQAPHKVF